MLNRLPILLAQLQAGNNSNKLKNEAKQILYSLYRSKLFTKTVYNNLIKVYDKAYDTYKNGNFYAKEPLNLYLTTAIKRDSVQTSLRDIFQAYLWYLKKIL